MLFQSGQYDDGLDWKERSTMILCGSNAMYYEQMVHSSHSFHLKYFLEKGLNVFVWNYRGYGLSTGSPSPSNLKKDVDSVFDYLRTEIKLNGKIGVYGRSLGGIPSSHLA